MTSLEYLQVAFSKAILNNDPSQIASLIDSTGISVDARLAVYQRNVQLSLLDVLKDTYPMVIAFVGERFFDSIAKDYIRLFPSTSGNIDTYGKYFPSFLKELKALSALTYVADIALYEWIIKCAHHASDATIDETQIIQQLHQPEEILAASKVILHPGLHLLLSDYPLDAIIRVMTDGIETTSAISDLSQPCYLMITRPEYHVEHDVLSEAEYHFMDCLMKSRTLKTAYDTATTFDEHFDAATGLDLLIRRRAIISFVH